MRDYPLSAIERSRDGAIDWLEGNGDGYPRSIAEEDKNTKLLGYERYDDFEAPPILGYEALEKEGRVTRKEAVITDGEERIHFELHHAHPIRQAGSGSGVT